MQSLLMPEWNLLSRNQQMEVARQVLRSLPEGFQFTGIVSHQLRDVRAEIAEFTWHGVRFCLIPGDMGMTDSGNSDPVRTWNMGVPGYSKSGLPHGDVIEQR